MTNSLFRSKEELFNLIFPLIFIVAAIADQVLGNQPFKINKGLELIITNVIFLNITHNLFTFYLLAKLPEAKDWFKQIDTKFISIRKEALLIFFLTWGITFLFKAKLFASPYLTDLFANSFVFLTLIFPNHHAFAQVKGLSLAYNSHSNLDSDRLRSEKRERWLFATLLVATVLFFALPSFKLTTNSTLIFTLVSSVLVLAILINSAILAGLTSHKTIYLLRLILIPLLPHSKWAIIGYASFHGVEYLFVFLKMSRQSKNYSENNIGYWVPIFLYTFVYSIVLIFLVLNYRHNYIVLTPAEYGSIYALTWAGSFLHYYFDRKLFSMRNPSTRKLIGPLLY